MFHRGHKLFGEASVRHQNEADHSN
jgi:hypothetical protein